MFGPHNPHRGLGPVNGNNRLNELLDQVRAEFDTQARNSGEYEQQCESSFPSSPSISTLRQTAEWRALPCASSAAKRRHGRFVFDFRQIIMHASSTCANCCASDTVMSQVSEMETIRQKLQYLESNQVAIKQRSAAALLHPPSPCQELPLSR